jgi:hypothetical protein
MEMLHGQVFRDVGLWGWLMVYRQARLDGLCVWKTSLSTYGGGHHSDGLVENAHLDAGL